MRGKGITRAAELVLRSLAPGQWRALPLPERNPERRILYQQVNAAAYHLWGRGNYRLEMRYEPARVMVLRLAPLPAEDVPTNAKGATHEQARIP